MSLQGLFREVIKLNECPDEALICKFSDPDGVRSGKSGWSFGLSQFDTKNNETALVCLRECGFTEEEIKGVVDQTIDVKPLKAKLFAHKDVVAEYDEQQLAYCLEKASNFAIKNKILVSGSEGLIAIADYMNQYGSMGDGAKKYFKDLDHPVSARDVLNFKISFTKYGKEHPDDCKRRYFNILRVMQNGA